MVVQDLRCEYRVDPLGIDMPAPRLSWIVTSNTRADAQTAYQVLVAGSPEALNRDEGDLWDSGKVASNATAQVAYSGRPLKSDEDAWWKVRAWDKNGKPSDWSAPARWTTGLLHPSDWKAQWIGAPPPPRDEEREQSPLAGLHWVWVPGENATQDVPAGTHTFRRTVDIPAQGLKDAHFFLTADDQFVLTVNGREAGHSDNATDAWRRPENLDVKPFLKEGANSFEIAVTNSGGPAGLIGILTLRLADGTLQHVPIDTTWTDEQGRNAAEAAAYNAAPWHMSTQLLHHYLPPSPFLRTEFNVEKPVKRAMLRITALGIYEPHLNGHRVGNDVFTPGWTDYRKRVYYQTYDVTNDVKPGSNALGAILSDGWACGYIGLVGRDHYGIGRPRLMAQLDITYADGSTETVGTDGSWTAAYGPIREGDLLMGETYDARREMPGWDTAGFSGEGWSAVEVKDAWPAPLQAYPGVPVRRQMELKPVAITEPKPGVYVFDLAQNMVGWARLSVSGQAGQTVRLRFAEMLNPDGTIYVTNLRSARATDTYTLKGGGPEVWEPNSTSHGFRYVELTGLSEKPSLDAVTGIVVHSDTPKVGSFTCSEPMINQLQHNIEWGQRGNFLEVPTDCPQRDERLGWMGDALVFTRTACNNMDVAAFFTKWMQDVEDAQHEDGSFTDVSPDVLGGSGTAAWADAGITVPWVIYQVYGDTRILQKHYTAMARYIDYMEAHSTNLLRPAAGYGDWLSIGADTPKDVLATAFFAYSTATMQKVAHVLGKSEDATRFEALFQRVKKAFNDAYVSPDGRIKGDTQTDYVLALQMDLLPERLRPLAGQYLAEDIAKRDGHLSTGFIGTAYLNPVLTAAGHNDAAYRLLEQDTFPGWGFSIKHGATTIWERWDGWTPEKGFQDPGMNSFNHYSFGAVGRWLFATVAGIDTDPAHPGFSRILVRPLPGGKMTHATATYDSIRGEIASAWKKEGDTLTLDVTIPANTTAEVHVPGTSVTEGGKPAAKVEGIRFLREKDGASVYEVGSGTYHFVAREK